MSIEIEEREVYGPPDDALLDALGFSAPSFLLTYMQVTTDCLKLLTPDGRILYANQNGLVEVLGGSLRQVQDTAWSGYWPMPFRPYIEEAIERAAEGRHVYCEVPRPTDDGGDKLWSVHISPIGPRDGTVESLLVVARDLTANANRAPQPFVTG